MSVTLVAMTAGLFLRRNNLNPPIGYSQFHGDRDFLHFEGHEFLFVYQFNKCGIESHLFFLNKVTRVTIS